MKTVAGLCIATGLILLGTVAIARPGWVAQFDTEERRLNETPTRKECAQMRIHGLALLAFGIAVLIAVLQDDGRPFDATLF